MAELAALMGNVADRATTDSAFAPVAPFQPIVHWIAIRSPS